MNETIHPHKDHHQAGHIQVQMKLNTLQPLQRVNNQEPHRKHLLQKIHLFHVLCIIHSIGKVFKFWLLF